jgi:hypothetical protein
MDTNEDYIELWFNQIYSEPIRKFDFNSQNLTKEESLEKRTALNKIV